MTGDAERDAIRCELEKILASPAFRNSKRYSSLLKHVVERTLEGRSGDLKERNLGVDVFGRASDYDTTSDHVVRSVAREVRRGLAQYYLDEGHEDEVRIELQPGSYVPQFRQVEPPVVPIQVLPPTEPVHRRSPVLVVGVVLGAVLATAAAIWVWTLPGTFDRFWNPFLSSSTTALLCVGGGGGGQSNAAPDVQTLSLSDFEHQPSRRMHTSDALALAGLAAMLQSNGKQYRILNRSGATSFRDLQSGPFILIGGMNNEWTLRLTGMLRFGFERVPNGARVVDRQNPSKNDWRVDFSTPMSQFSRDYAIVSRLRDPQTEQPAVIVAGIGSWGTLAAGEFVTHPEFLKKLEAFAPKQWGQKNLQVVLATDVIRGSSGPPNVLAAHFW
jgi:hypothetical protein